MKRPFSFLFIVVRTAKDVAIAKPAIVKMFSTIFGVVAEYAAIDSSVATPSLSS